MTIPFVDLRAQYRTIQGEVQSAIAEVLENTAFVGGPGVAAFEREFASWLGAPHCVSVANGTEAIEIALHALGISPGDEVIVPANSFIATSEAVTSVGARVVFADSDSDFHTLDIADARRRITSRTRAIIPVHLYGHPADMDEVLALAAEHGLKVIEDTAQAHGALYKGRRVGTFGDAATFSFYPGKNLGAYGDGGAILFRDEEVASRARLYANHGSRVRYRHEIEGRNSRLDGIQAAVLRIKLRYIDAWNERRRHHAARYLELLADTPGIVLPKVAPWGTPVWHLFVVRVDQREEVAARMNAAGVQSGVHYPVALPMLEAYERFGHTPADFPVACGQMGELLSLPMYAELTDDMTARVAEVLTATVAELTTAPLAA